MTDHAAPPMRDVPYPGDRVPRLIIADDDLVIQSALAHQLGRSFDVVGIAADADQAIDMARTLQPDLAILDVEMPGGGGLRATEAIRACAPATAIVALSSDESESLVRAMLAGGAMAYLRKGANSSHEMVNLLYSAIPAHAGFYGSQGAGA